MTDRNDYEKNYYIDRDGNRVDYDPKTLQPPIVYGAQPFSEADLDDLEVVDPDGFIVHESHGEYEPYAGDADPHSPVRVDAAGTGWEPVRVDRPDADPALDVASINGYEDIPPYHSDLAPENGKFHIRYYGVVEHSQFAPTKPDTAGKVNSGLVSLAVRGMGDNHLHTDLHTFNPLSLLAEGSCPPGSKVRVDIQDFENVILEYIYNYPRALHYVDYADNPTEFTDQTFVELGQWDGNKKMRLSDFVKVIADEFGTELGDLWETLAAYVKDRHWIEAVPTQLGLRLDPDDGTCLPYSHLPKPYVKGSFDYNPATRIGALAFDFVDYIFVPPSTEPRIYQMRSPQLLKAGTIPADICPKQAMRLAAYADVVVRSGCSEVVDESTDVIDLTIRTDGSVWVDGTMWFQHHKCGEPGVMENSHWRVEIATRSGAIFL